MPILHAQPQSVSLTFTCLTMRVRRAPPGTREMLPMMPLELILHALSVPLTTSLPTKSAPHVQLEATRLLEMTPLEPILNALTPFALLTSMSRTTFALPALLTLLELLEMMPLDLTLSALALPRTSIGTQKHHRVKLAQMLKVEELPPLPVPLLPTPLLSATRDI